MIGEYPEKLGTVKTIVREVDVGKADTHTQLPKIFHTELTFSTAQWLFSVHLVLHRGEVSEFSHPKLDVGIANFV